MVIFYWLAVPNYIGNVWKVNFLYKVNSVCIKGVKILTFSLNYISHDVMQSKFVELKLY